MSAAPANDCATAVNSLETSADLVQLKITKVLLMCRVLGGEFVPTLAALVAVAPTPRSSDLVMAWLLMQRAARDHAARGLA
ncbi:hypothetical protein [uncultured Phenylobacterium sp.]|uniref:hypothetical protein n=1 Tax=uncultured Phenylobacterium sp. TaxID=349273 RepID=UPI0025FAD9EC|nr:hypothetical protein [uncultured Phenylobacterium sp.]